jgi:predicted component of type VI protein secretion system
LSRANFRVVQSNARGQDTGFNLLGFIPIVTPGYGDAMSDLRSAVPMSGRATALANVTEDTSTIYLILFSLPRINITADVIEFIPDEKPPVQPAAAPVAAETLALAVVEPVAMKPAADGVREFCIQASPELNYHGGSAHSLDILLYQLSASDSFMSVDARKLGSGANGVPGIVGEPIRQTVYPGESITVQLVPHPDANLLGIVARYGQLKGNGRGYRDIRDTGPGSSCIALGPNTIDSP